MFRVQNNVPEVYPDKSRDFQMFCRLFDVAFSSVKQSIDTMENITDTMSCDAVLLPLLKDKLGFFSAFELSDTELRYVLQAFPAIIRYKGSQQAITYITNLYSRLVSAISSAAEVQLRVDNGNYVLEVSSEKAIVKTQLLFELLKYVLPTGYIIDYFVTEYQNSESQFYTHNKLVYSDGLFLQLVDPELTSCSYLTTSDNKLCCIIDGKKHFPLIREIDGTIETQLQDRDNPPCVLKYTSDRRLAFYQGGELTHYIIVDTSGSFPTLKLVAISDVEDTSVLTMFQFKNNQYIVQTEKGTFSLGMKLRASKIVIRKDVSTESAELSNIVGTTTIT